MIVNVFKFCVKNIRRIIFLYFRERTFTYGKQKQNSFDFSIYCNFFDFAIFQGNLQISRILTDFWEYPRFQGF